ncbi:UDP-N-acetylmuramoylalanine--D-glutamate ligase [Desulfovibrionales bacterium]
MAANECQKYHIAPRLAGWAATVVGLGSSGRTAARLLCALGAHVRVLEKNPACIDVALRDTAFAMLIARNNLEIIASDYAAAHFVDVDLVVISPGIHPSLITPLLPKTGPLGRPIEYIGELELASREVREPIVAITGTNGKTTTTTLVARFIEATGRRVFLGGNIGTPLSEYVLGETKADVLVLEVSSFQLMTCTSFHPFVAVLLNFSTNHLDWHSDLEEYLAAKLRLFTHQHIADMAVINSDLQPLLTKRNEYIAAHTVWFKSGCRFYCKHLIGEHNHANVEAAYQTAHMFGLTEDKAQTVLNNFHGLPHRLEHIIEKAGVLFVDDSKATTVEALATALRSFDRPIRLLVGGVFKGGDLTRLIPLLRKKVRAVGLFGASKNIFYSAWKEQVPLFWKSTLESAVWQHWQEAKAGEVILLSPATASFDLYTDYKARGQDFARICAALDKPERYSTPE